MGVDKTTNSRGVNITSPPAPLNPVNLTREETFEMLCKKLFLPSSLCIGDVIPAFDLPRSQCDLRGSHSGSLQIPIAHVPEQLQA